MTRAPLVACRTPRHITARASRAAPPAGVNPEPRPLTAAMQAGRSGTPRKRQPQRCAAEQHRLQRDMVHDSRPLAPVQRRDRRDSAAGAENAVAAPAPVQRLEAKPFGADPVAMNALACRDDDLEPGIPRGPRDRQAVRPEIPVLGDQKNQLRPHARRERRPVARRLANRSVGNCEHADNPETSAGNAPKPPVGRCRRGRILFNPSSGSAARGNSGTGQIVGAHPGYRRRRLYRPSACVRRSSRAVSVSSPACAVRHGTPSPAPNRGCSARSRRAATGAATLRDLDIVIHLAQRAHVPPSERILSAEPAAAAALARAAALAGVRRFLYVSSIKAMGESTAPGRPFRPQDTPLPEDAYGRAKLATEQALATVAAETGLELAILRPPLVYGPEVGGNFRALLRLARSGLPLPLAGLDNRRSLIARDNLVDLIATACTHPTAFQAGRGSVLLARDGADLSTPELIRILAAAQGRNARLFPLPTPVFAGLRRLPRLGPAVCRLTLSLQVDDAATRTALDWRPPVAA